MRPIGAWLIEPMALIIGFALDQQVPVQWAFSAPKVLLERLGTLDPPRAGRHGRRCRRGCRQGSAGRSPLSRCDGSPGPRAGHDIPKTYDGDAGRIWTDASDGRDLQRRIAALPGFGDMKVASLSAVLIKQLGVRPPGWEEALPAHPRSVTSTHPRPLPTTRPRSAPTRPPCARPPRIGSMDRRCFARATNDEVGLVRAIFTQWRCR